MQSWKLKKLRDKHYLRAGGPPAWSNFALLDAAHPILDAEFLWVNLEDYYIWLRENSHRPAIPEDGLFEDEESSSSNPVHFSQFALPSPSPSLGHSHSLPRYTTGSVGHGTDSQGNVESAAYSPPFTVFATSYFIAPTSHCIFATS